MAPDFDDVFDKINDTLSVVLGIPRSKPVAHGHYILQGTTLVRVTLDEWANWFALSKDERILAVNKFGNTKVSTVFVGLNGALFETMVWNIEKDSDQKVYCYEDYYEAIAGHKAICYKVMNNYDCSYNPESEDYF